MMKASALKTIASLLLCAGGLFPLAACDLYHEGHLTEKRVQVREESFSQEMATSEVSDGYLQGLARHYAKHGEGPVDLSVTYDPQSRTSTAMHASQEASRIAAALRAGGISDVNAGILPVNKQGERSLTLVSYKAYSAAAPEGCSRLSGMESTELENDREYRLGCTVEAMFAQQVARPKDLLGRGRVADTSEGRRGANIVELYRTGAPNEPLDGETASE